MPAQQWAERLAQSVKNNSPVILTGIAVGGVIATAVLAARAAVKVEKDTEGLELTVKEKIQGNWKTYSPAVVSGAATIACVIGANRAGARQHAALFGAYTLVDTAFREYKDKVIQEFGVTKERKVHDKLMVDKMESQPVINTEVIITGGGDQLCYESLTGRYFKSDIESIRRAENEINRRIVRDMYASQNEFYSLLGLAQPTIGDELGWNIENFIQLVFTSHLSEEGTPTLAVGYTRLPRADYGKF
jgi:hypothetical protein